MKPKLYQFQEDAMPLLMARKHNLLADEMGLGKTLSAIELTNRLGLMTVLIICKASIKENWRRRVLDYADTQYGLIGVQVIEKKKDCVSKGATHVIVNYDLISHSHIFYQLKQRRWDMLVCDEAHYLKNLQTKRTKAILAKDGLVHSCDRSLMLTGTPVLNRPVELYPMLKVLAPQVIAPYKDYWSFTRRYCDAWQDGFCLNVSGASHTDELNQKLRQHYMIRRTWNEVEVQLPKKRYEMVLVDQTAAIGHTLKQLEVFERRDFKYKKHDLGAGELATLRRETAEEKIGTCLDQIKEYIESVEKIVIFAYHHSVIERLKNELKDYGVVVLTGATSQASRQANIDLFSSRKDIRVFIGQLQAAGEGIDGLQSCCHNMLFVETSWVPAEISQAIARLWRLGQGKSVLVRFLVWANSVEEHMLRVALDKVQVIREIVK